jgi:hypothetical protein
LKAWVSKWNSPDAAWEERLSELRHSQNPRHRNVPSSYSENTQLGRSTRKGCNTKSTRRKEILHDHLPHPGIGKLGFQVEL